MLLPRMSRPLSKKLTLKSPKARMRPPKIWGRLQTKSMTNWLILNNAAAKDAYELAVAKADGDRKVALANCQAASGDAQKACKDQANADYDAAKASAKAEALAQKQ